MKYKVGVTVRLEVETEAPNEQDAIIQAMRRAELGAAGMRIRRYWWEYVKEVNNGGISDDSRTDERP